MTFNEDSRVKIPAILHLTRLGFSYISWKTSRFFKETNIYKDIFQDSMKKINPHEKNLDFTRIHDDLSLLLDYDDLGAAFYKKLLGNHEYKIIDFENFQNNAELKSDIFN